MNWWMSGWMNEWNYNKYSRLDNLMNKWINGWMAKQTKELMN